MRWRSHGGFFGFAICISRCFIFVFIASGGNALIIFSATTLQWLWSFLSWLASFPGLQWHFYLVSTWALVCTYLAIILIVSPRGLPGRG